jgi:hypothetical protein
MHGYTDYRVDGVMLPEEEGGTSARVISFCFIRGTYL